jgi:hypothetical protein
VAHELNAIGLAAKVAIIFGVNPMFLVNASRVGFESAGTCSGFRAAVLAMVVFVVFVNTDLTNDQTKSNTSATGRRGFCGQFPGRSAPMDNSMTGTSFAASPNSRCTASGSKPIIGVEPKPHELAT